MSCNPYLFSLPALLTCLGSHWKCVRIEVTLFSPLPGGLRLTWLDPQTKQDPCPACPIHFSSSSFPKLPLPVFPPVCCWGEAELRRRNRKGCLGVNWLQGSVLPACLCYQLSQLMVGQWTLWGSWIPSGLFMSAHHPLWQSQVNPRSNFSLPLKGTLSISLGSGRFTI